MVYIYAKDITIRMKYIFSLIFKEFMGMDVSFTTDINEYQKADGIKLNYSNTSNAADDMWIVPHGLLSELGIKEINIEFVEYQGVKCPFKVHTPGADYPFDLFSAAFYLITRYEEYLPFKEDSYGRFTADQSIAYKNGFLQFPVIDYWAIDIKNKLIARNPDMKVRESKYSFVPTLDIDVAYAYKLRGLIRTAGGAIRSIIQFNPEEFFQRFRVLAGLEKDPYDTYKYQHELHKKFKLSVIYFILFADYDINDKNISVLNKRFQRLIKSLGDYSEIGIHPSYNSVERPARLKKEIERLSATINKEITRSRQHFLRLNMPYTYRLQESVGIKHDYTMGYAREAGYRASTARPFFFYDLGQEMPTYLKIHPFIVMDGTLKDYMKLTPQQSEDTVKVLVDRTRAVNGEFISLWHNHSLSGQGEWYGWRRVYESLLEEASAGKT